MRFSIVNKFLKLTVTEKSSRVSYFAILTQLHCYITFTLSPLTQSPPLIIKPLQNKAKVFYLYWRWIYLLCTLLVKRLVGKSTTDLFTVNWSVLTKIQTAMSPLLHKTSNNTTNFLFFHTTTYFTTLFTV